MLTKNHTKQTIKKKDNILWYYFFVSILKGLYYIYIVMNMDNSPFIQCMFSTDNIRLFYMKNESPKQFFLIHTNMQQISPFAHEKVGKINNILVGLLKNKINIEVQFFYPTTIPNKYKREIQNLTGDIEGGDMSKVLMKLLLILMKI